MTETRDPSAAAAEVHRINQTFAGAGAAVGLVVWYFLFSFPLGLVSSVAMRTHPRLGLFLGFLAMLSVVPGAWLAARAAWGGQWRKAFPLAPVGIGVLAWTVLCILAFLPLVMAWALAVDRVIGLPTLTNPLSSVGVLGLVLGAPIAEEVLCRGYGLARIRELAGDRRALLYTATVFAVLHGSWVKLPGTFLIGLFLGWLVLRTGSLWPAFLGHFTNNGTAYLLSRTVQAPSLEARQATWFLIITLGATSLACLAVLGSAPVRRRIRGLTAGP